MIIDNTLQKRSAGGIVHNDGKFLTLHITSFDEIVFPKGTIEQGETPEQAAIREIQEETGYRTKIKAPLGEVSYEIEDGGKRYNKTVYHFLTELVDKNEEPIPNLEDYEEAEGFENLWLTSNEAFDRLTHDSSKDMLKNALELLSA
jgi:8-oxo-dGTP pyrophosphatase MutT (NUDIX family)